MNKHVAIAVAILSVMITRTVWQRRKHRARGRPPGVASKPDDPIQELVSPSGRFKAVAYVHDGVTFRVEVFRLTDGEPDERYWRRTSGPSFVDRSGLAGVMAGVLRGASGESV